MVEFARSLRALNDLAAFCIYGFKGVLRDLSHSVFDFATFARPESALDRMSQIPAISLTEPRFRLVLSVPRHHMVAAVLAPAAART